MGEEARGTTHSPTCFLASLELLTLGKGSQGRASHRITSFLNCCYQRPLTQSLTEWASHVLQRGTTSPIRCLPGGNRQTGSIGKMRLQLWFAGRYLNNSAEVSEAFPPPQAVMHPLLLWRRARLHSQSPCLGVIMDSRGAMRLASISTRTLIVSRCNTIQRTGMLCTET